VNKTEATKWAIHNMVVNYYYTLLDSVRKNITIPGLRFEDFLPEAQKRIRPLYDTIVADNLSCQDEAKKILSWQVKEQIEAEIITKASRPRG